jgi:hypothetical protein
VVVEPEVGVKRQQPDHALDQRQCSPQALVVPRLVGQAGEQVTDLPAGGADPLPLRIVSEQDLGDGDGDQFGVGEPGRSTSPAQPLQLVVDLHVECGQESVQVVDHTSILALSARLPPLTSESLV